MTTNQRDRIDQVVLSGDPIVAIYHSPNSDDSTQMGTFNKLSKPPTLQL